MVAGKSSPYRSPSFLRGVITATLVSGPLVVLAAMFFGSVWAVLHGQSPGESIAMIVFLPMALMVGSVVSLIPNLLGTAVMASLGRRDARARKRWIWTLGGAVGGGVMGFAISGFELSAVGAGDGIGGTALGGVCALICHRGTRWYDEATSTKGSNSSNLLK